MKKDKTDQKPGGQVKHHNVAMERHKAKHKQEHDQKEQHKVQSRKIEELEKELIELRSKAKENWDQLLLARADTENMNRRRRIDVENAHKYGVEKFAKELLNVVDSLEQGLEASSAVNNDEVAAIHDGMELTYKLFVDSFEKFGITQINPVGETFNPALHEALSMQESTDIEPNKILAVVQRGFLIYDRVLRPARVIVARSAETSPQLDEKA